MKHLFPLLCLLLLSFSVSAQNISHARINQTNLNLRGAPVMVGQLSIVAPTAGKVVVRFDGDCISTPGDRIMLAASRTLNWSNNDNSVMVKAMSTDLNSNVFSHTRVYDVAAGEHTFYAIAENHLEMPGSGKASLYGSLTAEWFPEIAGQAFVRHKSIVKSNFNVEGAPVILTEQAINAPVAGKVVVRFDGMSISSDGDLLFLAANNNPSWGANDGSASIEIADGDFNTSSFTHVRTYNVNPGNHSYYAVIENFYEIYGNGIASIYGSLTVSFYPNSSSVAPVHTPIVQIGTVIDNGPATLGEVTVVAPKAGKVLLNFTGTCIASFGDYIKLAANDTPTWGPQDGSVGFEPFSSDRNRTPFSHTRLFDVGPGEHHYYAVAENVLEFFGSGLVVVYGSLNATFFPEESVPTIEPAAFSELQFYPNPALDVLHLSLGNLDATPNAILIFDSKGSLVRSIQNAVGQFDLDVSSLEKGLYFVKVIGESSVATSRSFLKI